MAQTTAAIAGSGAKLEYSLNASGTTGTWVNISGYAASIDISGGEQITGNAMTMDGDAAIVRGANKTQPFTVTASIVYTETDAQPFDALWDRFKTTTKTVSLRWSYPGGAGGAQQYATTDTAKTAPVMCPIVSCTPPGAAADSGDPILFEFSVECADILKTTIAT
jgi:hypothetical protein